MSHIAGAPERITEAINEYPLSQTVPGTGTQ